MRHEISKFKVLEEILKIDKGTEKTFYIDELNEKFTVKRLSK